MRQASLAGRRALLRLFLADSCLASAGRYHPGGARMKPADFEHKWQRILAHLLLGNTLTRFEAEKIGDHALNSTVANIQGMGIQIARDPIVLEGRYGRIHCKRYFLQDDQRQRALKLLGVAHV
jgi:hypothetical protein